MAENSAFPDGEEGNEERGERRKSAECERAEESSDGAPLSPLSSPPPILPPKSLPKERKRRDFSRESPLGLFPLLLSGIELRLLRKSKSGGGSEAASSQVSQDEGAESCGTGSERMSSWALEASDPIFMIMSEKVKKRY